MRQAVVAAISIMSLATASTASAQDASATAADALFQSGKAAMDRGEHEVACTRLRESFRLQAAAGTLLNLGACEEKRGHPAVALQCFRDALAMLPAGDYRREYAAERLAAVRARVATARISVEGGAGVRLQQDGIDLGPGTRDLEVVLDPGQHVFAAVIDGRIVDRAEIVLAPAERREIVLRPRPETDDAGPRPSVAQTEARQANARGRSTFGPYVLMSAGGASVVAGTVLGVLVASAASEVRAGCDDAGCNDTALAAAHRGRPLAVLSPVFLGAGVALAAGGGLWWWSSRHVQPRVTASADGVGASFAGTF